MEKKINDEFFCIVTTETWYW